ncbi:MAG: adenylate/guanylate cyclase domain-containing protein [Planctomycetota bacterium]|nr:MAG: adenylate/guanylate cyclase domain-containing protein [Planctomycetota bacterium]
MTELVAQGPRPENRWRKALPEGETFVLGRLSAPWDVPWDDRISRRHARLRWTGERLEVQRIPESRNAIFFRGQRRDEFSARIGEHFVIGQTTFALVQAEQPALGTPSPALLTEQTFSAQLLRNNKFKDAGKRIEVLSKLPDVIAGAADDQELCQGIARLVLQGVPDAMYVAIVQLDDAGHTDSATPPTGEAPTGGSMTREGGEAASSVGVRVLHSAARFGSSRAYMPSVNLVRAGTMSGESVLHVWNRNPQASDNFTQMANVDWAFCTPVLADACPGWAIYVAGQFSGQPSATVSTGGDVEALQDDLKFTELTATTLGALRQVRVLQRRQDSLRNFFSPVVMQALAGRDPEQVLAPRETEVSVLFCDLRGFSQRSEDNAERLLELLQRVSDALGVMTHHILACGGVVGDFHGDAAMGFWGWPLPTGAPIAQACQAALGIRQQFERISAQPDHPLSGFRAGIGVATGTAVAGRIGTQDQVKVTVFGPVVNLASRLEGMTKQLQASILVDEPTAEWVRQHVSPEVLRVRRVAKVLPYGMSTPLVVSELLPPAGPDSILADEHVAAYEEALDHFLEGRWNEAFRLLHQVPADDQVKDFLTVFIAQHRRTPPPGWQGVIELPSK